VSKLLSNKNKGEEVVVMVMDTIRETSLHLKIFSHISFMGLTYLVVIDRTFNNKDVDHIFNSRMFMLRKLVQEFYFANWDLSYACYSSV
jgi:hypothetical protein